MTTHRGDKSVVYLLQHIPEPLKVLVPPPHLVVGLLVQRTGAGALWSVCVGAQWSVCVVWGWVLCGVCVWCGCLVEYGGVSVCAYVCC